MGRKETQPRVRAQWKGLFAPQLQQLQQRWQGLQKRERLLLTSLATLVVVTLFWLGIWQPLHESVARAEQKLESQQNYQRWFERQAQLIYQSQVSKENDQKSRPKPLAANELSAFLNTTTAELKLEVTRIQPQNNAQVLVFNEASFDDLLLLLEQLASRGVVIENLDVAETTSPGVVRVRRLQVKVGS